MITLHVEPRKVLSWDEFIKEKPSFSIALDGYVRGKPRFDARGPYANFNHHEEVDRLGTRATCAQVSVAIKQGLFDTFQHQCEPTANMYVNDPDQDTSLAVWILQNHERIRRNGEPLINRLVTVEDHLDVTAGAYPYDPKSTVMRELAWIFEPYTVVRVNGRLYQMNAGEMRTVIEAVGQRITKYTLGQGEKIPLDLRYEILGGGPGWKLVHEQGAHARTALFAEGTKAFVTVHDSGNETYKYSIGKMSPYIYFPLEQFYALLNKEEGLDSNGGNCWGGGDTIGGSPRMTGSKLAPGSLTKIINDELAKEH